MSDIANTLSTPESIINLTTDIVTAYVSNNTVNTLELPELIKSIHLTLDVLTSRSNTTANGNKPAVPIKKSCFDDYIICLEDGKKLKMLKRYLRTQHDMSPQQYRAKWGLSSDYPMVAPNYAAKRSEFAKKIGLGKHRK